MTFHQKVVNLFPSLSLRKAVKETKWQFTDMDLVCIIDRYAKHNDKVALLEECIPIIKDREALKIAKELLKFTKAEYEEFIKPYDNVIFAANVEGFLGHIIIGSANRYSIIEEDQEGRILIPKEQILDESVLNKVEEKLIDNSFYNMKISSRDELIALFMKMQNDREYSTAILTDTQNNIRMVVDIPNKMMNQSIENLNGASTKPPAFFTASLI